MFEQLWHGIQVAFQWHNLLIAFFGAAGGIIIGGLPGLSATMGVALLIPITFGMHPASGLIMLGAVYCGAIYGGSIAAILVRTPGTPAAAATVLDGYEMTRKGLAGKALGAAVLSSFVGGTISTIILIFVAQPLALFSLVQSPGGEAGALRLVIIAVVLALAALIASEVLARRMAARTGE